VLRRFIGLLFLACVAAQPAGGAPTPQTPPQFSTAPAASRPLDSIRGWLGGAPSQPELLPPEQAFDVTVRARDASSLTATLTPAPGYYLYRDRIKFSVEDPPGIAVDSVSMPTGDFKDDPNFGRMEVYHRPVEAIIGLKPGSGGTDQIKLHVSYQGCNEPLGVCYPPIEKTISVALAGADLRGGTSASPNDDSSDGARIGRLFARGGAWALVAAFFGFGLLLAFTPCMLPMIPILSGIIVGHGHPMTRRHALALSSVYVLAMATTYALAGVAAGLAGTLLSASLQNPWVLGGFAAIFVLLALAMFGVYELQLPTSIQSRLAGAGSRLHGGKVAAVFLMGVLSALIVGPCVAAPLAGALLYISRTGDAVLGGTALFSMAIGMGAPLLVVGATAGTLLPKAGAWTESVQRVFGVTMLAVAIYLVSPVIPAFVQQMLWVAMLIVPAMYLHAIDPLPVEAPGHKRFWKGVGVMALVAGVVLLIGALSGGRETLRPLAAVRSAAAPDSGELAFQPVKNLAELDARLKAASGRHVMLDFWAEWCVSCKEMERFTFSDPQVKARLNDVVLLRADVTANNADDQALLKRFALFGPPGIVFFDKQGKEIALRVIGFQAPAEFLASLDRAVSP
jgi:thiol:disulfide interchange protein DsbD